MNSQLDGHWPSILRCSGLGMLLVDLEGSVMGFTPGITDCFDLVAGDLGRPISHLRCKLDNPNLHDQIETVLEVGNSISITVEAPGDRIFLQRIDPHLDDQGSHLGAILTLTEITPFLAMLHGGSSSKADSELPSFAYAVSHDLQAPLRQIYQQCEFIAEDLHGTPVDSVKSSLDALKQSTVKVRGLMESLLEFSRINSHADSFTDVDLNGLFDNVLDQQGEWIDQLQATVQRDRLPIVDGDPRQLHKLFSNLIDNALRYRRDQAPEIECRCSRQGDFWQFSITDNGRGVDPRDFENVFTIFRRGDSDFGSGSGSGSGGPKSRDQESRDQESRGLENSERNLPGRGIGLAIARRIVARHGGRIWVASANAKGTTIGLTLPVDAG